MNLSDYSVDELYSKLEKADAAGDTAAASRLAELTRQRIDMDEQQQQVNDANDNLLGINYSPETIEGLRYTQNNTLDLTDIAQSRMTEGVANIAQNINNAVSFITSPEYRARIERGVEGRAEPNLIDEGVEWIRRRAKEQREYSPDTFVGDVVGTVAQELPGYALGGSVFKGAKTVPGLIGQEAIRSGTAMATTNEQEDLESAARDFALGATVGAVAEGVGQGVKFGVDKLNSKFKQGNPERFKSYANQYRAMKADVEDLNTPTKMEDVLDKKLKDEFGNETDITYRDMREVAEKFKLAEELNQEGGRTGVEIVQKMVGSKVRLEELGIVPNKTEQMWDWANKTFGSDRLKMVGLTENNMKGKRGEAIKRSMGRYADALSDPNISKNFSEELNILTKMSRRIEDHITGVNPKGFTEADELSKQLEYSLTAKQFAKPIGTTAEMTADELRKTGIKKKISKKDALDIETLSSLNRDLKAARKLSEESLAGTTPEAIGGLLTIGAVGYTTGIVGALAVGLGRKALSKTTTRNIGQGVARYSDILDTGGSNVRPNITDPGYIPAYEPTTSVRYHGSRDPYFSEQADKDLWTMKSRADADRYRRGQGSTNEVEITSTRPAVVDAGGRPIGNYQRNVIAQAKREGYDSLVLNNVRLPDGSVADVVVKFSKDGTLEIKAPEGAAMALLGLGVVDNQE